MLRVRSFEVAPVTNDVSRLPVVFANVDKLDLTRANAMLCFDERRDCVHHFVRVTTLVRCHADTDLALVQIVVGAHFADRCIERMPRPVDDPAHLHPFLLEGAHSLKLQHHAKYADDHTSLDATLERRRHFLDLEALNDVANLDVIVGLKPDATFESVGDVCDAVFEAAQ